MPRNMSTYSNRFRCGVCRAIIPAGNEPLVVLDTVANVKVYCCTQACRERYWGRYQLALDLYPSSNTGVILPKMVQE